LGRGGRRAGGGAAGGGGEKEQGWLCRLGVVDVGVIGSVGLFQVAQVASRPVVVAMSRA
jgi:hypothetical protein